MREEHAKSDASLLWHQFASIDNLNRLQLLQNWSVSLELTYGVHQTHWRKLLHNGDIVQRQLALLTQLHARNTSDHLCAGCDPEDCIASHVLVGAFTLLSRCVLEYKLALLVHGAVNDTGSAIWIFRDIVHLLLQASDGIGFDRCHGPLLSVSFCSGEDQLKQWVGVLQSLKQHNV